MTRKASRASVRTDAAWLVSVLFVTTLSVAACDHAASPVAPTASDDVTSPALRLSGAVVDRGAGSPVVGARVEVVDGVNQSKAATTDGDGRYVLADLQAGSLSLRAAADGFGAASQTLTLTSDNVVNFDLTRQNAGGPPPTDRWSLSGTVTDSTTRAGVAGARIEFTDGSNKGQAATSDIQGRYRLSALAPGTSVLRARRAGYLDVSQSVTIDADRVFDVSFQRESSPAPTGPDVAGRTVDAISQRPLAGVLVRIEGLGETTTGGDGRFDLAAQAAEGSRAVTMRSAATVERQTRIRVPGDAATLTLIPQSINLAAFDQMFRGRGALHRWVNAPQLVVQRRVLRFTNTSDESYVATAGLMSDAEVSDLVRDLTWTLPQLTGDTFGGFAGVRVETAAENDTVSVSRSGTIVVARYDGLTAASSYWGYSRWAWNGPGEIQVGILMIDKDFDTSGSEFRRSLRAHELGHTLGYDHVTACPSVMNAAARSEPNAFDRDGAKIAFLRQPFNQSPDIDPDPTTISRMRVKGLSWAGSH